MADNEILHRINNQLLDKNQRLSSTVYGLIKKVQYLEKLLKFKKEILHFYLSNNENVDEDINVQIKKIDAYFKDK